MPAIIDDGYTLTITTPAFPDCEPISVTYRPAGDCETNDYLEGCAKQGASKVRPEFLAAHIVKWSLPNKVDVGVMKKMNHQLATYLTNCIQGYEEVNVSTEAGN